MKMRHVPVEKQLNRSNCEVSKLSIKKILRQAGYSIKEISRLQKQNRIVIVNGSLGVKLKSRQELYIIEDVETKGPDWHISKNRFKDLTREE